jgi:hypothetical protein
MFSEFQNKFESIYDIDAITAKILESSKDRRSLYRDMLRVHLMAYRKIQDPKNGLLISDSIYESLREKYFLSASGESISFEKRYGGNWRQIRKSVQLVARRHNNPIPAPKKGINGARKSWIVNGKNVDYITMELLEMISDNSNETNIIAYNACCYIEKIYNRDRKADEELRKKFLIEKKVYVDAFIEKMYNEAIKGGDNGKIFLWEGVDLDWIASGHEPFGGDPFTIEEVVMIGKSALKGS